VALDVEHGARAVVARVPPPGEEFGEGQDRGQGPHGVPDRRLGPHGVPDRRLGLDVKNLPGS